MSIVVPFPIRRDIRKKEYVKNKKTAAPPDDYRMNTTLWLPAISRIQTTGSLCRITVAEREHSHADIGEHSTGQTDRVYLLLRAAGIGRRVACRVLAANVHI